MGLFVLLKFEFLNILYLQTGRSTPEDFKTHGHHHSLLISSENVVIVNLKTYLLYLTIEFTLTKISVGSNEEQTRSLY